MRHVPGLERDVGHAHDRLAGEAVGARAAAGGAEADGGGALAVRQRGAQDAALDEVGAHGGDALVVPAERAQAAGQRRVGGDVHAARSRSAASPRSPGADPARARRRRPRRAGCGRARARARSTRGPAARPARRAARSCSCPAGTAARVSSAIASSATRGACAGEVEAAHVLPAGGGGQAAAVGRGVGAHLQVAAVGGVGGEARRRMATRLLGAGRALGRGEGLALAPCAAGRPPCARGARRRCAAPRSAAKSSSSLSSSATANGSSS